MNTRDALTTGLALAILAVPAVEPALAQATVEAEIATAVVDRMPEGVGSEFGTDVGEVYLWTRVSGAEGTTIQHVWRHGPHEFSVPLTVEGSPWRTWSSKVVPPEWTGEWTVEIRDGSGNLLDALSFTVG